MYKYIKRFLDIVLSVVALPIIFLITIFVGIAIILDDGRPVFFKAQRIGYKGKIFGMLKFRTMFVNSPDLRHKDGSTINSDKDPRVTRVGNFLRKTSIDELPQILNVLIGQMSFIGPRPDSADYLPKYTEAEKSILKVRPGITGYNQAINRNSVSTKEKLKNDIYYVRHVSFILDLKIIYLTIKTVLSRKNLYRDSDLTYNKQGDNTPGDKK